MCKSNNFLNGKMYQYDAFDNYIEFSCYTDQLLTGLDTCGNEGDIMAYEESIEIGLYENIKKMEALKHAINAEYLKHVSIAKQVFNNNFEKQKNLGLLGIINFDFDSWIEHVKIFYITILSDSEVFDIIYEQGISLEDVENAIELMIQLEEYIIENYKETENKFWN
jgi:hypothetical protein